MRKMSKQLKQLSSLCSTKAMEDRAWEAEDLVQTTKDSAKIAKFRARAVWYRAEVDRLHQRTIILILQAEQRRITAWNQVQRKKKDGQYLKVSLDPICSDESFTVLQWLLAFLEAEAKVAEDQQTLAYVTDCDDGTLSIVAIASHTVIDTISLGKDMEIDRVAIAPNGTKAYVTSDHGHSYSHNSVSIIDTASNTVMDTITIEVGKDICDLAITPDSMQVYMMQVYEDESTDDTSLILSIFDIVRYRVIATIDLTKYFSSEQRKDSSPHIAIAPDGTRAYVVNCGIVIVIATATNQVIGTISIGGIATEKAITPDGKKLYVTNEYNYVSVIDTENHKVIDTIKMESIPYKVAITPDGKKVYVRNERSNNVTVIATADDKVIATIALVYYTGDIAFTPDGKKAYITHASASYISVIDTASDKMIAAIHQVPNPERVAISRRPAW
jgi:YVTN family beta-propeller protein